MTRPNDEDAHPPTSDRSGPPRRIWGSGRSSPAVKIAGILSLLLIAGLALAVVEGLVAERWSTARTAAMEIGGTHGGAESLRGPMLVVAYDGRSAGGKVQRRAALILPSELSIEVEADADLRYLGIFSVPVFDATARLRGAFVVPAQLAPDDAGVSVGRSASLYLTLENLRRVGRPEVATLGGLALAFEAGTPPGATDTLPFGLVASVTLPATQGEATRIPFEIAVGIPGSELLRVAPVGERTTLSIEADWPHPGFRGPYPPVERAIGPDGFTAAWRIDDLARGYPRIWADLSTEAARELWYAVEASETGVELVVPADPYQQATRAIKYGLLIVGATFGALFVFELTAGLRIHPVRYVLVAAALSLFFVLLIAFAEVVGFASAYAIAAMAVVLQILLYMRTVLERWRRAGALAAFLSGLYLGLYVLLGIEQYALVAGAVFLFLGLSAIMWATRRLDWSGATPQAPGLASVEKA